VLLVAWASWYTTSHQALVEGQKVADMFKDVVVVGVHHQNGFEKAPEFIKNKGARFPIGRDVKGEFFKAMRIEAAGPNYYIVDRAGNLRFLDVDKASLPDAIKIVNDEKPEDAAKAEAKAKEGEKDKGGGDAAAMGGPDVKARVTPEEYKAVKWPAKNKDQLSAKDFQGKALPAKFGNEKWLSGKAPDREGKIIVIDFWATWCPPCRAVMPKLDEFSKRNTKDVVVMGISNEEEATVRAYIKKTKHSYPQAVDPKSTLNDALGVSSIPHVVVLSTDGVVRYQGHPGDMETLERTVKTLVDIDPGVKARRAAEKK
jgi:thiol-disulfide isomerase/thioredoxin